MIDERERKLLNVAKDLPIGPDFLSEYTDDEEMLSLGLRIAIRRLLVIICNTESAPKDIIPAARLIFLLNGKDVGAGEDGEGLTRETRDRIASELKNAASRSQNA